jgi:hypothetical protein
MSDEPILQVVFFRADSGRQPVREWLKELDADDLAVIGEDIKLVQFRKKTQKTPVQELELAHQRKNLWLNG